MPTIIVQETGVISTGGIALGTYSPAQAVDLCVEYLHGYPVTNVQARACDIINSWIWTAYPWRWTLKNMTPFSLTNGVQDYAAAPVDMLRIIDARIVRTDLTPSPSKELLMKNYLSPESVSRGFAGLSLMAFEPAAGVLRLDARVATQAPEVLQVQGRYQFLPPRITDADLDSIFYFPDVYFDCYVEGLKWKFYQLADDDRAGQAVSGKNGVTNYSGQLGMFIGALERMKESEDYADADTTMFPEDSLGAGNRGNAGLFSR